MHYGPLIATIVVGLVLAFALGALAHRLRIPPLVGYLLAGVIVGPSTPGFVANQALANELAEIGVILLMFGVGLHFSVKDLMAVRAIAIPGAVAQIAAATLLGMGLAALFDWSLFGGFIFGMSLSVASTVVLLRAMQERRLMQTERGRIAVGWLIVEDLATVLALVLVPAIAGLTEPRAADAAAQASARWLDLGLAGTLLLTLGKVAAFVAVMLIIGRRVIPWVLHWVAHTGSRELFRLSVLAVALGVAFGAAVLFDVSFALGAFFAGMILSESQLSQQAAQETLPLRDAFAVLFFVSVGMLFDPVILVDAPLALLATLAIILLGKSAAAFLIVRAFGWSARTALTISASLAQIGEFSFILAGLGVALGLLPPVGRDLILAGAIITIMLNPLWFWLVDRFGPAELAPAGAGKPEDQATDLVPTTLTQHTVLIGYGRVGCLVGRELIKAGAPLLVLEDRSVPLELARSDGAEVLSGNAAEARILGAANIAAARRLLVAIPNSFEAGQIVQQARALNPGLEIVARAHSDAELEHLEKCGASATIMGEREIARRMVEIAAETAKPRAGASAG
jgi:CPA2 family monovalent cation:H+ antiporter-2